MAHTTQKHCLYQQIHIFARTSFVIIALCLRLRRICSVSLYSTAAGETDDGVFNNLLHRVQHLQVEWQAESSAHVCTTAVFPDIVCVVPSTLIKTFSCRERCSMELQTVKQQLEKIDGKPEAEDIMLCKTPDETFQIVVWSLKRKLQIFWCFQLQM